MNKVSARAMGRPSIAFAAACFQATAVHITSDQDFETIKETPDFLKGKILGLTQKIESLENENKRLKQGKHIDSRGMDDDQPATQVTDECNQESNSDAKNTGTKPDEEAYVNRIGNSDSSDNKNGKQIQVDQKHGTSTNNHVEVDKDHRKKKETKPENCQHL